MEKCCHSRISSAKGRRASFWRWCAQLAERDDLLVELSEVKLPANFRVTDEGVDFIFGLYEVAPYSSGEIEVELNAYALAHLLTDWAKTSLFQLSGRS